MCWFAGFVVVIADTEPNYDVRLELRGRHHQPENLVVFDSSSHTHQVTTAYALAIARKGALAVLFVDQPPADGFAIPNNVIVAPQSIDSQTQDVVINQRSNHPEFSVDPSDGIVRRFGVDENKDQYFPVRLAKLYSPQHILDASIERLRPQNQINFAGPLGTIQTIQIDSLLEVPKHDWKRKIVFVQSNPLSNSSFQTPVGIMSRSEILANVVANIAEDRVPTRTPIFLIAILLIGVVWISIVFTNTYPQSLSLFLLCWTNGLYVAGSLWLFDTKALWTPIFAPLVTSALTHFIFVSFQLTIKDYMATQLEKERQYLLDVEELKSNFLSLISHDLKTPIAKIQAICDRMITEFQQPELVHDVASLKSVASELHRYIQTLLQLARVEARNFHLKKDASDINAIIQAVIERLQPLAVAKNISVSVQLEPMFLLDVDSLLMEEVLLNLVDNAIKYTPAGGFVTITTQELDSSVFITVQDNGPGIAPEEQTKIFERFYRGESGKSHPKGSGLGLYLVKYFVELHNGEVTLHTTPQTGTRFVVRLPVHIE